MTEGGSKKKVENFRKLVLLHKQKVSEKTPDQPLCTLSPAVITHQIEQYDTF